MTTYLIIFGAAVRRDGSPSGSLLRRVEGAFHYEQAHQSSKIKYLATGGVGRYGPAEAIVMRNLLLERSVSSDKIILETEATDTLESVMHCNKILSRHADVDLLVICTSNYHQIRCATLLRILGYKVTLPSMAPEIQFLGVWKWSKYVLKECLALPYDVVLLLIQRMLMRIVAS